MLTLPGPLSRTRMKVPVVAGHLARLPGRQASRVLAEESRVHGAHLL